MNLNDPFQPRPCEIHLMFSCEPNGSVKDLRRGIRRFLSSYVPVASAFKMAFCPNYTVVMSRDKANHCIMLTADGSPSVASVLIELYARLLTAQSMVKTDRGSYMVSLDGTLDLQRVNALSSHFMWLGNFFDNHIGSKGERHLLN